MKILFIAPAHNNLYLDIKEEMERQGHIVTWLSEGWDGKDGCLEYRFTFKGNWKWNLRMMQRRMLNVIKQPRKHRWMERKEEIDRYYDMLFCINGLSIHSYLLDKLKKHNPNIRKVLYLWDDTRMMSYQDNAKYFDKVYTYDLLDALSYKWSLLPMYWLPIDDEGQEIKYDISLVGLDHGCRATVAKAIRNELQKSGGGGYTYFFKLFQYGNAPITDDLYTHELVSPMELTKIMAQTNCILDTDRESQTGTTPRLLWALALGKKVLTTNEHIKFMPFYNPQQIKIVDRRNPIVDVDFISRRESFPVHEIIQNCRIDKWVQQIFK